MTVRTVALAAILMVAAPAWPASCLANPAEPVVVHVSILPQGHLASRIGGDRATVRTLVPIGQSPHSFELTPRQVAELAASRVYFAVGLPFEERVLDKLGGVNPGLTVIDTSEDIPRRRMEGTGVEDPHDHGPGLPDPHTWLNPRFAAIMAGRIRDGLVGIDPDGAEYYDANLATLLRDLEELDERITLLLEPYRGRSVYVFHPAFGYFTDHYGLVQVPIETAGREPLIRGLAAFVERARADGANAVFIQSQFPERIAEAVAEEIGARVVALDPLDPDYIGGLERIAVSIVAALAAPPAHD